MKKNNGEMEISCEQKGVYGKVYIFLERRQYRGMKTV